MHCARLPTGVWTRRLSFPPGTTRGSSERPAAATTSDLVTAGVKIYEYEGGLLHTKSLTLDGEVTLIGSANMDRRSFELNYENNILFHDPVLTGAVRERQQEYICAVESDH